MNFSRRKFLWTSLLLSLSACSGVPVRFSGKRAKYFIPSPELYWKTRQDFSRLKFNISPTKFFPQGARSLLTVVNDDSSGLRRVLLPGYIHSLHAQSDYLHLVTVDRPSLLMVLDAESLELVEMSAPAANESAYAGHIARLPRGDWIAVAQNSLKMGVYDTISIKETRSLRELTRFSTHGFEAHELVLSPDGKYLYVGHYGSYMGSGAYREVIQTKFTAANTELKYIYPACVSVLELSSGRLMDRLSSVYNGQQGHLALGGSGGVFLASKPAMLENRSDTSTNPIFGEGEKTGDQDQELMPKATGFGTTVVFDPATKQVLIPFRMKEKLLYLQEGSANEFRELNLKEFAPDLSMAHGLCLHPDGRHYVISSNNWLLCFERTTHKFAAEKSFPLELFVHSHFATI